MASAHAELPDASNRVSVLANPWFWMAVALICCGSASLWIRALGESHPAFRFSLVISGLLCALASLNIRLRSTHPTFLAIIPRLGQDGILVALMILCFATAVGVSGMLVVAVLRPYDVWWRWGPTLVCWIVVAPMSALAMVQSFRCLRFGQALSQREEGAVLLLLAALACFAATWGLYDPAQPLHLDKMRLFLGVLTLAALAGAPLVLLPPAARFKIVSLLVLLHFGGIFSATLIVSPSPMADTQLWNHIYRPYLEFFYLTNAYHFYSPDPGPSTYLWFRVLFESDVPDGPVTGAWYKVPDVDEEGRNPYPTSVDLPRYLCLTWNTLASESPIPFFAINKTPFEAFDRRFDLTPEGSGTQDIDAAGPNIIPWHPEYYSTQQYLPPVNLVKNTLLPSFVRHVLGLPEWANRRIKGVKIYRVNHEFLPPEKFCRGIVAPGDPDSYGAVYLGEYDTSAKLVDADDPLLYWFIPVIREWPLRDSPIRCYIRRHAGDPLWIRDKNGQWVAALK